MRCTKFLTAALQHGKPLLSQAQMGELQLASSAPPPSSPGAPHMAAAETIKTTVEQFTAASNQA
ncbi:hypothetical protein, partial [Mycobacterium tuberculosis]